MKKREIYDAFSEWRIKHESAPKKEYQELKEIIDPFIEKLSNNDLRQLATTHITDFVKPNCLFPKEDLILSVIKEKRMCNVIHQWLNKHNKFNVGNFTSLQNLVAHTVETMPLKTLKKMLSNLLMIYAWSNFYIIINEITSEVTEDLNTINLNDYGK